MSKEKKPKKPVKEQDENKSESKYPASGKKKGKGIKDQTFSSTISFD